MVHITSSSERALPMWECYNRPGPRLRQACVFEDALAGFPTPFLLVAAIKQTCTQEVIAPVLGAKLCQGLGVGVLFCAACVMLSCLCWVPGCAEGSERARHFVRLWTLKEAYVKAVGRGIGARPGLSAFSVCLEPSSSGTPLQTPRCQGLSDPRSLAATACPSQPCFEGLLYVPSAWQLLARPIEPLRQGLPGYLEQSSRGICPWSMLHFPPWPPCCVLWQTVPSCCMQTCRACSKDCVAMKSM